MIDTILCFDCLRRIPFDRQAAWLVLGYGDWAAFCDDADCGHVVINENNGKEFPI